MSFMRNFQRVTWLNFSKFYIFREWKELGRIRVFLLFVLFVLFLQKVLFCGMADLWPKISREVLVLLFLLEVENREIFLAPKILNELKLLNWKLRIDIAYLWR